MKNKQKSKLSKITWLLLLIFLATLLTFPKWITYFYPKPYEEIVYSAAEEHKLDPYLVFAIIRVESKYQPNARSSVGAIGLMQIMPDTAKWIALQKDLGDFDIEDLNDPDTNIRLGSYYIANLLQEYQEMPTAIAAYNAGRGKVASWISEGVWTGSVEELDDIPFPETREYVKNVLKSYAAYRAIYE